MSLWISVDVEADGPCPGLYSMVSFGAIVVDEKLDKSFYGEVKPINANYIPEALAVSGITREQHLGFESPLDVMRRFHAWLLELQKHTEDGRLVFVSDNPAFDWQFINYYLHAFCGDNPFGFSARRIGDLCAGMYKNVYAGSVWKRYRKTKHTHNPLDDAKGNAEALLKLKELGLKAPF